MNGALVKVHVVIQTAFIGDLFLTIPFLNHLKKLCPDDQIILICKKGLAQFFLTKNLVHECFEIDKGQRLSYRNIKNQLNQKNIVQIFCLHQSIRSSLLSYQIKSNKKYGFIKNKYLDFWKKWIFDKTVDYQKSWPEVIRQMSLLTAVDSSLKDLIFSRDWSYLNFPYKNNSFEIIPEIFSFKLQPLKVVASQEKKIGLFPGSVWATKRWDIAGFVELAKCLSKHNFQIYVLGGKDDMQLGVSIKSLVPEVEDFTGQMSLLESANFLQSLDLIICNDSAPAHMAAFYQRPVLALFGPTVLDFGFRPWNNKSQVIQVEKMSCRPCGPHGHHLCPKGHHDCMKKITAQEVYHRAHKMLGNENDLN